MNQATNQVNPEAGTLKQKKNPISKRTGNLSSRTIAFAFPILIAMLQSSGLGAAESASAAFIGWYNDSTGETNDSCCKWERSGPGKPKIRPVQIGQPSERAFRLADYEVTRNMILSLQEKPMPVPLKDYSSADREIADRFLGETTVEPVFSMLADESMDLAFRSENIQGPAAATLVDMDSMMDERFRAENGMNG
jgi:hypothetical protein